MLNLFAYRATDPKVMKAQADPVGPENDRILLDYAARGYTMIAAWGQHGKHGDRQKVVRALLGNHLQCLGLNADGAPKHPLYLKGTTQLQPFT